MAMHARALGPNARRVARHRAPPLERNPAVPNSPRAYFHAGLQCQALRGRIKNRQTAKCAVRVDASAVAEGGDTEAARNARQESLERLHRDLQQSRVFGPLLQSLLEWDAGALNRLAIGRLVEVIRSLRRSASVSLSWERRSRRKVPSSV